MNLIIRGLAVYFFILIIFRIAGKKSLSESTTFDLVLLLIISEVTQQALVGEDFSLSACFLLITTLVGTDVLISYLKFHWEPLGKLTEGKPLIIVNKGIPLFERMYKARVEYDDVLEAARQLHGIGTFEEIEYAVLEKDGSISIIPKKDLSRRTTSKTHKDD